MTPSPRAALRDRRFTRRLQRQDPAAMDELHRRHGAIVYGYLRKLVGDEAEDVFQQVMMEAWKRGDRFDPARGSALTWLMSIARSRGIDCLRRRRPDPLDPHALPEAAVELEADHLLERWSLAAHLQRLDPQDRELLFMRFHRQMSQTEIAAETGLALGTVKTRMVRGLERLRESLDAERVA